MPIYQKSGTGQILLTSGGKIAGGSACCCGGGGVSCTLSSDGNVPSNFDVNLSSAGSGILCSTCNSLLSGLYTLPFLGESFLGELSNGCEWGPTDVGTSDGCISNMVIGVLVYLDSGDSHYKVKITFNVGCGGNLIHDHYIFIHDFGTSKPSLTAISGLSVAFSSQDDTACCDFSGATVTLTAA